jgi:DNA mismatch repair protein MutS
VKRGVTELVTPGVSFNDQVLDQKMNNFLCSLHLNDKIQGVSFLKSDMYLLKIDAVN